MNAMNRRTVVAGNGCLTCKTECEKHIHITPTGPHPRRNVTEINKGSRHCKKLQIKKKNEIFELLKKKMRTLCI